MVGIRAPQLIPAVAQLLELDLRADGPHRHQGQLCSRISPPPVHNIFVSAIINVVGAHAAAGWCQRKGLEPPDLRLTWATLYTLSYAGNNLMLSPQGTVGKTPEAESG